jgi:hypothetical protein
MGIVLIILYVELTISRYISILIWEIGEWGLLKWATSIGRKSLFTSGAHLGITFRCAWHNFISKVIKSWLGIGCGWGVRHAQKVWAGGGAKAAKAVSLKVTCMASWQYNLCQSQPLNVSGIVVMNYPSGRHNTVAILILCHAQYQGRTVRKLPSMAS